MSNEPWVGDQAPSWSNADEPSGARPRNRRIPIASGAGSPRSKPKPWWLLPLAGAFVAYVIRANYDYGEVRAGTEYCGAAANQWSDSFACTQALASVRQTQNIWLIAAILLAVAAVVLFVVARQARRTPPVA